MGGARRAGRRQERKNASARLHVKRLGRAAIPRVEQQQRGCSSGGCKARRCVGPGGLSGAVPLRWACPCPNTAVGAEEPPPAASEHWEEQAHEHAQQRPRSHLRHRTKRGTPCCHSAGSSPLLAGAVQAGSRRACGTSHLAPRHAAACPDKGRQRRRPPGAACAPAPP